MTQTMFSTVWWTLVSSFAEAGSLFWSGGRRYLPWILGSALFAIPVVLAPAHATPDELSRPALVMMGGLFAVMIVLACWTLADAVRTIQPGFKMTPMHLLLAAVAYFATTLATDLAALFLYVPGFYVGVKLSMWLPNYLLGSGESTEIGPSATRSWNETTGAYWETLVLIFAALLVWFVALIAASTLAGIAFDWHAGALVALPVSLAVTTYVQSFMFVAWLKWANTLASRSHAPIPQTLPAQGATS